MPTKLLACSSANLRSVRASDWLPVRPSDLITGNQVGSWREDPAFKTQVSYAYKTPCVLICEPPIGPGIRLAPGSTFRSDHGQPGWLVARRSSLQDSGELCLQNSLRAHLRTSDRSGHPTGSRFDLQI